MGFPDSYCSITITSAVEADQLPEKVVSLLAKWLKNPPERIKVALEVGKIRLSKVLMSGDVEKLIAYLEKNGLHIKVIPMETHREAEHTTQPDATSPSLRFPKTLGQHTGSGLSLPSISGTEEIDWQKGDVIEGLYEVRGSAAGGMGKVYFIFHRLWKMMLAIKTPLRTAVRNEARLLRFLREAELWVNLGLHPNIATCYYARVIGGLPRLFIEYVDGGTLDRWQDKGLLKDLKTAADFMLQFSHGMLYAESQGMMHRDIKPANCLISRDKTLKITDFGLVKRVEDPLSDAREDEIAADSTLTTDRLTMASITMYEGGVVGSPWYMAPERFKSKMREDIRSDIYSFGVMLYEIILDDMPFALKQGFTLSDLVRSHLKSTPVDPRSIRPELPSTLVRIIMTCLEKKPENRYPSFLDVCNDFEQLMRELRPGKEPRMKPNLVGLKADSLNNQAVSLMDLGREDEARALWEDAHSANTEHLEAVYNLHVLKWTRGEISDREIINRLESLKIEVRETADYRYLMGLVSLQRGDPARGVALLKKACTDGSLYADRWRSWGDPKAFVGSLGLNPIGESASFAGHIKKVRSVSFSPRPGRVFSAGEDRSIRVWDMDSGRCLKHIRTFNFSPAAGAFSPDGLLAATAYGDAFKTIDLWDMTEGRLLRRYPGAGGLGITFSRDSHFLASFASDRRIRILETASDRIVWQSPELGDITCIVFLGENGRLAVGTAKGEVIVLHMGPGKELQRFRAHDGPVCCIEAFPGGDAIITGGEDESIAISDYESGKELKKFTGHRGAVTDVSLTPDGDYVVSVALDGAVKIWDGSTGRCYRTIDAVGEDLTFCSVSPDGKRLLTGGAKGSVRLWSLETGWFRKDFLEPALCRPRTFNELAGLHRSFKGAVDDFNREWRKGNQRTALGNFERVRSVPGFCWSKEAMLIRTLLQNVCNKARLQSFSFVRSLQGHTEAVMSLSPNSDGLSLLTGSLDGYAAIWDIVTGRCTKRVKVGHPVLQVLFLTRSQGFLTWSKDRTLRKWDIHGKLLREIEEVLLPVTMEDGDRDVIAMSPDKRIVRIGLETGSRTFSGPPIPGSNFVCFSRGLGTVYSLKDDRRIQRWSVNSGRNEGAFRDLGLKITSLAPMDGDEKMIAGVETGELLVYMVGSGVNIVNMRGHSSAVRALARAGQGQIWLTGSDDCSVKMWDLAEERCLATLEGHSAPVRAVCFFPNQFMVASGSSDGSVRLWGLEWELLATGFS
ncbi:MAG TPA: serine/threonine-protein kinase [Desulfomonilaceae bacterium]|nr:serine/threonine-protein kinase [Desulfomonilaceae bacterium]